MLKGISPLISPELLKVLDEMGHGDEIVLADADKGNYALNALNPANGSVTLFIGSPPKVPLVLQLIVYEVKNIPLASASNDN